MLRSIGEYDRALEFHLRALTIRERIGDREGIAALVVLASIGVPLIVWVVVPFWTGRSDDPLWLAGLLLGVLLGVVTRYNAMRGGPVGGDQFATPWMVRGFVLWVVASRDACAAVRVSMSTVVCAPARSRRGRITISNLLIQMPVTGRSLWPTRTNVISTRLIFLRIRRRRRVALEAARRAVYQRGSSCARASEPSSPRASRSW